MPPSSFPSGLQPIGSKDFHGSSSSTSTSNSTAAAAAATRTAKGILRSNKRVSRTELDFEQALRAEGTVVLREGLDVDSLGVLDNSISSITCPGSSPSLPQQHLLPLPPPFKSQKSRTQNIGGGQPFAATAVAPSITTSTTTTTTTPSSSSSSSWTTARIESTASSSLAVTQPEHHRPQGSSSTCSNEIFYDAEDGETQTRRRSMYRAPGTASSPDLATLLRKAKAKEREKEKEKNKDKEREREREGVSSGSGLGREGRRGGMELPLLSPNRRMEDGSSVGVNGTYGTPEGMSPIRGMAPYLKGKSRAGQILGNGTVSSSDWVLASPRSVSSFRENGMRVR